MSVLLGEIIIKQWIFGILLFLTSLFLILLVLVQRGRGGGLSGALGGMGGQSAFGAKAGDFFTRVTIGAAIFWILLCLAAVMFLPTRSTLGPSGGGSTLSAPAGTGTTTGQPAEESSGAKKPAE